MNASPLPTAAIPVKLHLEGDRGVTRDMEKSIDLDGAASGTVEFALEALPNGLWRGHVGVEAEDELAFDDRRYFAIPVLPPASVLWPTATRAARRSKSSHAQMPEAALRLAAAGKRIRQAAFEATVFDLSGKSGLPDLDPYRAVVLANVASLGPDDVRRLGSFVERGGGLLVFTGDRVQARSATRGSMLKASPLAQSSERPRPRSTSFRGGSTAGSRSTRSFVSSMTRSTATSAGRPSRRSHGSSPTPPRMFWPGFAGTFRRLSSDRTGGERSYGSRRRAIAAGATGRVAGSICRWFTSSQPMFAA